MREKKDNPVLIATVWIILAFIVIAVIVGYVFLMIKYGSMPISEIPTWVAWLLFGGKGK